MPRSLRIAMITPQWHGTVGGPSRVVERLVEWLRQGGHEVSVLTTDTGNGALRFSGGFPRREAEVLRILKGLRPDIIHIHGRVRYLFVGAVYRSFFNANARLVLTLHTQPHTRNFLPVTDGRPAARKDYSNVRGLAAKVLLRACNQIVAVSESMVKNLNEQYHLGIRRYRVIPNGTTVPLPNSTGVIVDDFIRQHGLEGCYPILSTVGVLVWDSKVLGVEVCIRAVRVLREHFPAVRLLVAGDGHYMAYLKELVDRLDLTKSIVFLGTVADVGPVIGASDICLHLALNDASSLAIAEAMAARKCVIGARRGGIPESIQDSETGVLIEPNPPEVADNVEALLVDKRRREALAANAYDYACQKLNWSVMCREYESLYLGLAS